MTSVRNRRSDPQRFDLYTRGSLYFFSAMEPFLAMALVERIGPETPGDLLWGVLAFSVVHAAVCILLLRASIRHLIDDAPRPDALRVAAGLVTLLGVALILLWPQHLPLAAEAPGPGYFVLLGLAGFYIGPLTAGMPTRRAMRVGAVAIAAVVATLVVAALPVEPGVAGPVIGGGTFSAITAALLVASYRLSVWMLAVVWELDRSRQTQARLAVAEERLRFGRDLHDVLGRNLSAIAVKSELAAQLARRGKKETVDQMMEVHQIAEDSLKEVRDVVRGYRMTDLDAELAGSRSLLEAAGVSCRIVGDAAGLGEDTQAALGWVVREGTTNVLRRSNASNCTIRLHREDGIVTLTMENDGTPDPPDQSAGGSGLVGLDERLSAGGGTLEGQPRPGGRYMLEARMPLSAGKAP